MPPTVPTTRGYFGSAFWGNGFFGSDYWKERVPVPTPTTGGGGIGMGGSGGPPIPQKFLRPQRPGKFHCPVTKTIEEDEFVKACATKLRNKPHPENGLGGAKVSPDKITKYEFNLLNQKVNEYKEHVRHLEQSQQATKQEISRLKAAGVRLEKLLALALKEREAAEARAEQVAIETQEQLLAALTGEEFHAKVAAQLAESLETALGELKEQYDFGFPKERVFFGLGSVLAALATFYLIPDDERTIKFVGYGASAYLAARAITK
jgi:hypothetical protein